MGGLRGHDQYQLKLSVIRSFEQKHRFQFLGVQPLAFPPNTIDIPLMWTQISYSLCPSTRRGDGSTVSMATVRHLRSAASQFLGWEMMVQNPLSTFLDQQQRVLTQGCRATDNYSYTLFSKGMTGRLGTESNPSAPLLFRHVLYMDQVFNTNFLNAATAEARRRWALAGLANLLLWLGWLRSMETFSLTYEDIVVVEPPDGPTYELPPGVGMVLLRLLPQTKTNGTARADVVIAHTTLSGLSPGRWCGRIASLLFGTTIWPSSPGPIFLETDGTPWSSLFFRTNFVYPSLQQLQAGGDPYLLPFQGEGNTIPEKFWALHMYRRGARSQSTRGGSHLQHNFKVAKPDQVYEHGRWRKRRSSQPIDKQYSEWSYAERLYITLFCQ